MLQNDGNGHRPDKDAIYTVTQITSEIRHALTKQFFAIWIQGEISDLFVATSGHIYLSLKDENSQIRCAMFRKQNTQLTFEPISGIKVVVYARVDIYQPRGDLQLIIEHMEPVGFGELQLRFERLKKKLDAEGLFDEARKKPVPAWPNSIGIITSPKGAALHDALSTLKNRFIAIDIVIYPTLVQGKDAAAEICQTLKLANQRREVDTLLLVRGGGSLEDLQAFNEETVARQIKATDIPVISGIGHEIDFTIADFVSDFRAPTPTAAAIKASPDSQTLRTNLGKYEKQLTQLLHSKVRHITSAIDIAEAKLVRFHPINQIQDLVQKVDSLQNQMLTTVRNSLYLTKQSLEHSQLLLTHYNPSSSIESIKSTLHTYSQRITATINKTVTDSKRSLHEANAQLAMLSPYATLKRGYAFVRDDKGQIVCSSRSIRSGMVVNVKLAHGSFDAEVKNTRQT